MSIYLLQWRHSERDGVSNHRRLDGLLKILFRRSWKKTLKLCVTCLCERKSPATGEFPSQRANNAEKVSIWWRHHIGVLCHRHGCSQQILATSRTSGACDDPCSIYGHERPCHDVTIPMMTSSHGNILRVTSPLQVESTGHCWIPLTKSQWSRTLMLSLMCACTIGWKSGIAGDLRCHNAQLTLGYCKGS